MRNIIFILPILLTVLVGAFAWLEFVYFAGEKENENNDKGTENVSNRNDGNASE